MNKEKAIQAMLSPKVVLSKGEYIEYLLDRITVENATLQHAMESDKFHVVGASAALIQDHVDSLRIALDA